VGVSSRTTCGRVPGYSTHGPGAFQVALKTRPAAICSAIGVRNAAMAVITSTRFCGTEAAMFLGRRLVTAVPQGKAG
jgi:hypothetical protein